MSAQPGRLISRKQGSRLTVFAPYNGARRDHLMFALMLGTGMRLGSLVALHTDDVDLSREPF